MDPPQFEERGGLVASNHEWGRWHQSITEVNVEINLVPGTSAKNLNVRILPNELECKMLDGSKVLLKGKLFNTIKVDESIWTVEEKRILRIVLAKLNYASGGGCWTSLFRKGVYPADKETEQRMRNKLELEMFQSTQYPGMGFSHGKPPS